MSNFKYQAGDILQHIGTDNKFHVLIEDLVDPSDKHDIVFDGSSWPCKCYKVRILEDDDLAYVAWHGIENNDYVKVA